MEEQPIRLERIGVVHTEATSDRIRERKNGVEGIIEVFPRFEEALDGIEGYSHIFVIAYFDQLRKEQIGPLKVKPRGMMKYGIKEEELPLLGVFALDSPTRPNPIGLSLVPLIERKGNLLSVRNLEYFDGTPVLDIKPYQSNYRVEDFQLPDWHERLLKKTGQV